MTEDDIKKLIEDGKAAPQHRVALLKIAPGTYCIHRSWGFGKIASYDPNLGKFLIDFKGKPGHAMEVRYAAESLQALPVEHILARKATDPDALRKLAADQPIELMRIVLNSYDGQATADQIAAALHPDVLSQAAWKKWWDAAKRAMRKDPHFGIGVKKNEPFVLRGEPIRPEQEALAAFEMAMGIKQKVQAAEQLLRVADQVHGIEAILKPVIHGLSAEIEKSMHRDPAMTLEAIWVRDELATYHGEKIHHTVEQIHEVIKNVRHLGGLIDSLPSAKQKRLLPHVRTIYPDTWHDTLRQLIMTADTKLAGDIIEFLISEGQADAVRAFLERTVREQSATGELLLWICRSRNQQAVAGVLRPILNVRLMSAILQALQRDQFEVTRRKNQLLEFLLNDSNLVTELVRDTDIEEVRDIARKLIMHPAIAEMDRRSMLGRIIKLHPPIQALLVPQGREAEQKPQLLVVSWESLEQRKIEYDDLITRRIPANTKDIGIARSYGDLRENFEFKAAKEMQKTLMTRKAELEHWLANSRGTDFADASADAVAIGAVVTLQDLAENKTVRYAILGAWDSDVERGIISYQTALAQALLNKKAGEEADFQIGDQRHHVRVEKIERYVDLKSEIGPPFVPKKTPTADESSSGPAATASTSASPNPPPAPSPTPTH